MPCPFSTFQLPKVLREWSFLYILTSERVSPGNGVRFFIFHLPRWLRTCPFRSVLVDPPGPQNSEKTEYFVISVSRTCTLFLFIFFFSDIFPSQFRFSDSCHVCFSICPSSWKLDFYMFFRLYYLVYVFFCDLSSKTLRSGLNAQHDDLWLMEQNLE